jgi:xanthine dehydrogenase molybdenum-binding subunit
MTTASRATALATAAGRKAAQALAEALSERSITELAGLELHGEYIYDLTSDRTRPTGSDLERQQEDRAESPVTHMTFGYATQVVLLDEDGRVERVVAAHDVGYAINPQLCAGQIEGAVHMGLGQALSEDLPCHGAKPVSLRLRDLGILKAADTPEVEVILVEVPDRLGGYGSKGVGEVGLVPTAGAVASAFHALDGHWRSSLPMTAPFKRENP